MMAGAVLRLPPRLDLPAARPLAEALLEHAGAHLTADASRVEHLGGLALQLLLAADRRWRDEGLCFAVEPRSAGFDDALRDFGVMPDSLARGADA